MKPLVFRSVLFISLLAVLSAATVFVDDFLKEQKRYSRVRDALKDKESLVNADLAKLNMKQNEIELLILAFKEEQELQLYVRKKGEPMYHWLKTYEVCASSGGLGPKAKSGDGQVPEGFYHIDRFNPVSIFHLSLGLNYPNTADKRRNPSGGWGGDIFIHGSCVTIGCLPMTDDKIKEIYLLAVFAKNNGQSKIPVYVFPFKMTDEQMKAHEKEYKGNDALLAFWKNIKPGFDSFIQIRKPLNIDYDKKGNYTY